MVLPEPSRQGDRLRGSDDWRRLHDELRLLVRVVWAPRRGRAPELQATLEFYRLMGQLAPVAIAEEWNDLVVNLETAASLVPGDPESEQLVAMTAYATEPSAYRVQQWLKNNCGLDIPITTIAPQEAQPARTTTIAPSATTDPGG